jgi:pilus assembly protein CpaB
MSPRTILVVFLALLSGAGMAAGVLRSNRPKSVDVDALETESVVVAKSNLDRGKTVTKDDVEIRDWPRGLTPSGTLRTIDDALDRVVVGQVLADEFVLDAKLASKDAGLGLAAMVPPGMRAFTIMASNVASNVAGFVLPGNRVDVLLNLDASSGCQ